MLHWNAAVQPRGDCQLPDSCQLPANGTHCGAMSRSTKEVCTAEEPQSEGQYPRQQEHGKAFIFLWHVHVTK